MGYSGIKWVKMVFSRFIWVVMGYLMSYARLK